MADVSLMRRPKYVQINVDRYDDLVDCVESAHNRLLDTGHPQGCACNLCRASRELKAVLGILGKHEVYQRRVKGKTMAMQMQFQLVNLLNDLDAQFVDEDKLREFMKDTTEALRPFSMMVPSFDTKHVILETVLDVAKSYIQSGALEMTNGELDLKKLNGDPTRYIKWVGTDDENAHRVANFNPQNLFNVVYDGVLRYFQQQFDAGSWKVNKDPSTSRIYIELPGVVYTLDIAFTQSLRRH